MVEAVSRNIEIANVALERNESQCKTQHYARHYFFVVNADHEEDEVIEAGPDQYPEIQEAIKDHMKMRRLHNNPYHYKPQQMVHRYRTMMPTGSELRKKFLQAAKPVYESCEVCNLLGIAKKHPHQSRRSWRSAR